MKHLIALLSCLIYIQAFASCNKTNEVTSNPSNVLNTDSMKLKKTVGENTFTARLYSNETVTPLKEKLPLTINMKELNANEKYFDLPNNLPSNATSPGIIQAGDLMLYGSNTLVLFYKSFSTSYNYTKLAQIDNPSRLAAALGPGNKTVKFELE